MKSNKQYIGGIYIQKLKNVYKSHLGSHLKEYIYIPTHSFMSKLDIGAIRGIIQSRDDGIHLLDLARMLRVTQEILLNFIDAKRDKYGEDPFGQQTTVLDMEEAIQILICVDEAQKLYFQHITYLGYVERYRGAWGPPWEDVPYPDTSHESVYHRTSPTSYSFQEFRIDQYGSFLTEYQ